MESPKNLSSGSEPRSLLRILGIFEAVSAHRDGLTLAELSSALEAPKSSVLSLLKALVSHDYLTHDGYRYTLGHSMYQLSSRVLDGREFTKIAGSYLEKLALATQESVYLAAIDRDSKTVVYLQGIESRQAVRYVASIGTRRPLEVSAAGKALLAFQAPEWQSKYLRSVKLKPLADKRLRGKDELLRELETIRASGISISIGEAVLGAAGIAAPIVRADGTATYAFMVAAPSHRFQEAVPALCSVVKELAVSASHTLGDMTAD